MGLSGFYSIHAGIAAIHAFTRNNKSCVELDDLKCNTDLGLYF